MILLAQQIQFVFILTLQSLNGMAVYSEALNALTDYLLQNFSI